MKSIGIFGLVCVILFSVLGVYSCTVLQQVRDVERKLADDRAAAIEALREMPRSESLPKTLAQPKFDAWLRIRERVTAVRAAGDKEKEAIVGLLLKRLGNDCLVALHAGLVEEHLQFDEYRAMQARWRALVARDDQGELREAWNRTVRAADDADPLPLPAPAEDAGPDELALLAAGRTRLVESMPADVLTKLLETVEQ